jgi:hypothetical protein
LLSDFGFLVSEGSGKLGHLSIGHHIRRAGLIGLAINVSNILNLDGNPVTLPQDELMTFEAITNVYLQRHQISISVVRSFDGTEFT